MFKNLIIVALAAVLIGTFGYSGYVVAREALLGPESCGTACNEARQNGQGTGRIGASDSETPCDQALVGEDGTPLAEGQVACPFGLTDCSFPGKCNRYIDADGDGQCDLSKPQVVAEAPGTPEDPTAPHVHSDDCAGSDEEHAAPQGQGAGGQELGQNSPWSTMQPDWQQFSGTVVAYDHEIMLATASGEVEVGVGQMALIAGEDGFPIQVGDEMVVIGYMEDDELKARQIDNLSTGQQIILRDENGRPLWSGQGGGKNR